MGYTERHILKDSVKLADNEIRDIIKYLEAGKSPAGEISRKIAVKVVEIFGNDTMNIIEVTV